MTSVVQPKVAARQLSEEILETRQKTPEEKIRDLTKAAEEVSRDLKKFTEEAKPVEK
jgi:hypothetical protein